MGKVATHTNAPRIKELNNVNAAAIGRRKKLLPGEVSEQGNLPEKSAEVIVVGKTSRGRDARSNNDTGGLNR